MITKITQKDINNIKKLNVHIEGLNLTINAKENLHDKIYALLALTRYEDFLDKKGIEPNHVRLMNHFVEFIYNDGSKIEFEVYDSSAYRHDLTIDYKLSEFLFYYNKMDKLNFPEERIDLYKRILELIKRTIKTFPLKRFTEFTSVAQNDKIKKEYSTVFEKYPTIRDMRNYKIKKLLNGYT